MKRLVLNYHSIDDSGSILSVSPEAFAHQVETLHELGYAFVTISDLLSGTSALKRVALSFDDGFGSVVTTALPILEDLGAIATVFPIVAGLGRTADWTRGDEPLIRAEMINEAGLRTLAAAGWEIGGHGVSHACLLSLGHDAARAELSVCRTRLRAVSGVDVAGFAYPQGCWTREVVQMVRDAGYSWACSTLPAWPRRRWHPWLIPRVTIGSTTTATRFRAARSGTLQSLRLIVPGRDGLWHRHHRHGPDLCSTAFE